MEYEIRYGEKKMQDGWTSKSGPTTLDTPLMSGIATPMTPHAPPDRSGTPNYYA